MSKECARMNTTLAKYGMACPKDAVAVIVRKYSGDVAWNLCSAHIEAYRNGNIKVIVR